MIMVKISAAAVGSAPIPAPLATCPKKTMHETIDHTSHVYGWGFTLWRIISLRYGKFPTIARSEAMIAMVIFTFPF